MESIKSFEELKTALASHADDEYREFTRKIILTDRPLIGVRIPKIRKIVGHIDRTAVKTILSETPISYEEVIARGMIIARLPYQEMLAYFDSQIDQIDDWSTCDTFCAGIRPQVNKHREEFLSQKIEPLLISKDEFPTRVGLVLLKCCYISPDYIHLIFDRVTSLAQRKEYYVRMAIAWLLCDCYIKFPDETRTFLESADLPTWTHNKTISKICDSYRVPPEEKTGLKRLRK